MRPSTSAVKRATLLAIALLLAPVASAQAQNVLEPELRSIAFELPTSESIRYGIWRARSPRTNVGLNFTLEVNDRVIERPDESDLESSDWTLAFGPSLKYYLASGPVAPHIRGDLEVGFGRSYPASSARTDRIFLLGLSAGLGADWFATERLSIGGYTGLGLNYTQRTEDGPGLDRVVRDRRFGTITSGLSMHLYF